MLAYNAPVSHNVTPLPPFRESVQHLVIVSLSRRSQGTRINYAAYSDAFIVIVVVREGMSSDTLVGGKNYTRILL